MRRRKWEPNPETILDDLLAAVGARGRFTRKGDKRPRHEIEATLATKREHRQREQARVAAERIAEYEARKRSRGRAMLFGNRQLDRVVEAMRPGAWHGLLDVGYAAGMTPPQARAFRSNVFYAWKIGYIERVRDPAWRPPPSGRVYTKPEFLYRLSPCGLALRRALALLQ